MAAPRQRFMYLLNNLFQTFGGKTVFDLGGTLMQYVGMPHSSFVF